MKVWLTSLGLASLAILVGIGLLGLRILPSAADSATNGRRLRMWVTGYTSCDASIRAVKACDGVQGKPHAIVLDTVKGAGIKEVEETMSNHSMSPKPEVFERWAAGLKAELQQMEGGKIHA